MLQTQAPTTQYTHCTKKSFRTPDHPQISGAWFHPVHLRQQLTLVGLAGTAHTRRCYELNPLWIETLTAAGFRVLLLDYRGHGESMSDKPTSEFRLIDYVHDVQRSLQAAGLPARQVVLVGHSLGAGVAFEVAASVPAGEEPFAGIIALGGVASGRWREMYLRGIPGNFVRYPRACWRAMRNPQEFFLNPHFARKLLFQPSTPEPLISRAIELTCPESGRVLTDLCFGLHTRPLCARRALFVSGAHDSCVPPTVVYQSVKDYQTLGGCKTNFRLLDGAPHNLMMDGPVEEAAGIVVQEALACEAEVVCL